MATFAPEVPVLARDEAFEKLYRRYVKDVYHYSLALLRNPADAEDVTQTTFLNAYRAYQRGEEIRKPHNWLIKIAHNVARSRYARTSRRVKEVPLEDHVEQLALPDEEKPNVVGVLHALGRLPFNQRAALVMRELEGRSYTEIADTLGVSVAAVETLIFRARRSLRVRTASLRSILAVPVPSSLTHLFDGGGAAAGGIGASMLLKTAVALVVGSIATGLGVEKATRAVASPSVHKAARVAVHHSAVAGRQTVQAASAVRHTARVHARRAVVAHGRIAGKGMALRHSDSQASVSSPVVHSSEAAPQHSPAASSAPNPAPAAAVTQTVQTVDAVAGAAQQAVTSVTSSLPVKVPPVPPLPVQPPPVPKLP
jgi:RNA polymerase sigma factor (sigma-70 family)